MAKQEIGIARIAVTNTAKKPGIAAKSREVGLILGPMDSPWTPYGSPMINGVAEVIKMEPREKEGGVFVYFRAPPTFVLQARLGTAESSPE